MSARRGARARARARARAGMVGAGSDGAHVDDAVGHFRELLLPERLELPIAEHLGHQPRTVQLRVRVHGAHDALKLRLNLHGRLLVLHRDVQRPCSAVGRIA